MKLLGIHVGRHFLHESNPVGAAFHDAAAVLIEDGQVLAAMEEERLTRMKHCNCFAVNAVNFCLESTHTQWKEINRIAINQSRKGLEISDSIAYLEDSSRRVIPGPENHLGNLFERAFGVDMRGRFSFCHHHLAHAWSAFIPSGFEHALVVSLDGNGDNSSGMILTANGHSIKKIRELSLEQSLGDTYTSFIQLIGYSRFDEYKVMGLAPYGDPKVFESSFAECYHLLPDGDYVIEGLPTWLRVCQKLGILSGARRKGEPFSQLHKDLAATIQQILETIVLHILRHYRLTTGEQNLCMAGGVVHNCTMNGKILRSGLFDQVFVQPAAHDAGGALGAALWAYHQEQPNGSRQKMSHLYYGGEIGTQERIASGLRPWSEFIEFRLSSDVATECAALLADDAVIAWVQGRSEFGPRALGNRSILADPRPARNKTRINTMIKKREGYRPFAPSVLEERLADFFDVPPECSSLPFMIFVVPVREEHRCTLAAVTHVDGTARVHSVSQQANPIFWRLLKEFERLTGIGMLLNTSFNNDAEPIVESLDDAVATFLTTDLSYLVVGPYIVSKRAESDCGKALSHLRVSLPLWRKLVIRHRWSAPGKCSQVFEIESTKSKEFGKPNIEITEQVFQLLQSAAPEATIADLMQRCGIAGTKFEGTVLNQLLELWTSRAIILKPYHP